jgi:hypothetical protein
VLSGVCRVLKEAKRRRYVDYNVLDEPACFLRVKAPNRSFIEVVQVEAFRRCTTSGS